MIKLRDRQVELVLPSSSAVFTTPQPGIVGGIHDIGIGWVNPHIVKIAVGTAGNHTETATAIYAGEQRPIRFEDFIFVFRVDDEVAEVERPPDHEAAGIEASPTVAAIVGTVERAFL